MQHLQFNTHVPPTVAHVVLRTYWFWNYALHASSDAEGGKLRVARMC
jgi:hypothetical protein